jgi:beta-glucanase (GH16 family)
MKKIYFCSLFIMAFLLIELTINELKAQKNDFELVWSDEFDKSGLPDSTKWSYDVGGHGWGNDELEYYTYKRPENARIENGQLIIEARKEDYKGKDYTSARLIAKGNGDWLYGRIEVRAKLPHGRGTWPAAWMLSNDWTYGAWPESGEIDIMEHVGHDLGVNHVSCHSLDYQWKKGTQKTASIFLKSIDSTFYTYTLEWRPDRISAFVDDSLYFILKKEPGGWTKWPFDKPFCIILNVAIGGAWAATNGIDESVFPQELVVDYVRVYKYRSGKDNELPTAPVNLKANTSTNRITLLWDPGYDNYGVKNYKILCNDKLVGTSVRNDFEIDDLKPNNKYPFKVLAVDWSGNESPALEGKFTTKKSADQDVPGLIQAEDYITQSGVYNERTNDTLGGIDVCWIEPGDWLNYSIDVDKARDYVIDFRSTTERVDGLIEVYNSFGKLVSSAPIVNTHGWQTWRLFHSSKFRLEKGKQILRLKGAGDRISLNWFNIRPAGEMDL